jgi:hypothetical protein
LAAQADSRPSAAIAARTPSDGRDLRFLSGITGR